MSNQDLVNYIKEAIKENHSKEEVVSKLLHAGWKMDDINQAFTEAAKKNKKTNKKPKKILVFLISLIVILVVGVFIHVKYFPSTFTTVQLMKYRMSNVDSFAYNIQMHNQLTANAAWRTELTLSDFLEEHIDDVMINRGEKKQTLAIALSGSVDASGQNDPKIDADLIVTTNFFSMGNESNIRKIAKIGAKYLDRSLYLKLNASYLIELLNIKGSYPENEWTKIPLEKDLKSTTDKIAIIQKNIKKHNVVKVLNKLSDPRDDKTTDKYQVVVRSSYLPKAIIDIIEEIYEEERAPETRLEMERDLRETLNDYKIPQVYIWVGKKDYYLHKISLVVETKDTGKHFIDISLSKFNKINPIDKPSGYKILSEFKREINIDSFEYDYRDYQKSNEPNDIIDVSE